MWSQCHSFIELAVYICELHHGMHGEEGGCLKHLTDHGYEPLRGTMPIELFSKLPDHSGFDPMAADTPSMLLTSVNITS